MAATKAAERTRGFYKCTHCGAEKEKEEEVTCWECGDGEMIFTRLKPVAAAIRAMKGEQ